MRLCLSLLLLVLGSLGLSGAARADDIDATQRSVVRVVTVAIVNGEVVGFGHGSGFAIAPNRIITNAHVVGDAAEYPENVVIGIVPSEGSASYPGRLLRIDRRRDLALVEIVRGTVPPASLFSGAVPQRETVFALGYPGNVDLATAQSANDYIRPQTPVASDGIVSSTTAIGGVGVLVHDADIARGNSGGPLIDRCGRVIGVNNAITRADEGDSPFSFAVSIRELAGFLQDAGQRFTSVSGPCVTMAEVAARDAASRAAAEQARAATEAREAATRAEQLAEARADAQAQRETYIAGALALFAGALLAGMATMMFAMQGKARQQRLAMIAAGLFAAGAVGLFLLRPDPRAITADSLRQAAATQGAGAANTIRPAIIGDLTCRVLRDQSRLTASAGTDAALSIDGNGCVNGRTQYADDPSGRWSRTLVPDQDATIRRMSYDPASGNYVVEHWFMALADMQRARGLGGPPTRAGCTTDAAARAAIAEREAALAALLNDAPNERIVHSCTVRSGQGGTAGTR